jgi:hypothetical protein
MPTAWQAAYDRAKNEFILGHFAQADALLKDLISQTNEPIARARAEELLSVTEEWNRRGATLVEQKELQGSDLLARRTDRRTGDEIGVLYTSSVLYGLGTGLWIAGMSDAHSVEGVVLPPLLFAGGSAGVVALLDSGQGLRYGTAQSISTGMWLGLWQGIAWGTYYQATTYWNNEMDPKQYTSLLFATTTAGAITGGLVGTYHSTTPGRAAFVGSSALWPALILGCGVAALSSDDGDTRDDNSLLAASIGLTAGTVTGMLFAGDVAPTTARVRFLDLGALAGGLALGGLFLTADQHNPETALAGVSIGSTLGLSLAWWLTSNMPKDHGAVAPRSSSTFVPMVTPQRGGMTLGVAATF